MKLSVPDMSCGHCVRTVETTIKALDGTARVDVDLAARVVNAQTSLSIEAVAAALREAGYESRPVA